MWASSPNTSRMRPECGPNPRESQLIRLQCKAPVTPKPNQLRIYPNTRGFGSILFSFPEWAKSQEGFGNIHEGIRLVLECSKTSRIHSKILPNVAPTNFIRATLGKYSGRMPTFLFGDSALIRVLFGTYSSLIRGAPRIIDE